MRKAKKLELIPPYLFAQIDKKKAELISKGVDIINFGIGDPDLPTPKHITESLHRAIDDPDSHGYPPYEGTKAFRRAVAAWYKKRFGIDLDPENEVISLIGSKEGIAHIFPAFVDPGDITLCPDPAYPVYKIGTLLANGKPFIFKLRPENNFLPDFSDIDPDTAQKAKILFINYPNNPTGASAPEKILKEAVEFCKEYDILLCSDLAYSEIAYDSYKPQSIFEIPGAKDIAIEFHSLSKTYNMTAHRIGMAVGNAEAICALSTVKTNIDSGVYKAIQTCAVTALTGPQECIGANNKIWQERRDILVNGLNNLGWEITPPQATFYVFAPVPKGFTSASFAEHLLAKCGILVVPGTGYGEQGEGFFRLAITINKDRIKEAIVRLKQAGISFSK